MARHSPRAIPTSMFLRLIASKKAAMLLLQPVALQKQEAKGHSIHYSPQTSGRRRRLLHVRRVRFNPYHRICSPRCARYPPAKLLGDCTKGQDNHKTSDGWKPNNSKPSNPTNTQLAVAWCVLGGGGGEIKDLKRTPDSMSSGAGMGLRLCCLLALIPGV